MTTQFNVQNFLTTLTCPIGLDPLTGAVSLFPCCHKVNEAAAMRYYGRIVDGGCELKGKLCIVCNTPVTTWIPDHTVRDIAARVFGYEKELESLPKHPLVLEEKKERLPYPGKPGVFVHTDGDWEWRGGWGALRRVIFKSKTEGSFLKSFCFSENGGNQIFLRVCCAIEEKGVLKDYLESYGIRTPSKTSAQSVFDPEEIRKLFGIIARHNQIPLKLYRELCKIVEGGEVNPSVFRKKSLPIQSLVIEEKKDESRDVFVCTMNEGYEGHAGDCPRREVEFGFESEKNNTGLTNFSFGIYRDGRVNMGIVFQQKSSFEKELIELGLMDITTVPGDESISFYFSNNREEIKKFTQFVLKNHDVPADAYEGLSEITESRSYDLLENCVPVVPKTP